MTGYGASWPRTTVGELLKIRYGKALSTEERDPTGPVPVVGSAGRMTGTHTALITTPAVLIGRKGSAGAVRLELDGCWPIDTTYYAEVPATCDPRFLRWQLHALDLGRLDSSTTTPSLRREDLEAQAMVVPPFDEQRRIVDLLEDHLSRLDAADAGISVAEAKLERLRERLVLDTITGADEVQRIAAALDAVGTNDGELAPLPPGWTWARLGDVADVVGGVTKDSKRQGDPSFVEVPYLRVANVQRGFLKLDEVTTIRVDPFRAKALLLEPGDVLLNEGGDRDKLARGWVWEGQIAECIHQNHVFRARIKNSKLDPYFLSWTTNTLGGRWAERNGKQSVNLASISLSMIKRMPVIVPEAGEATRRIAALSDRLSALDRLAIELSASKTRGAALRRSLLSAAFSGRLTGDAADLSEVEGMIGA